MNLKLFGVTLLTCMSFPIYADVSLAEKENTIHFIENSAPIAPSVSLEAFRRELEYEKLDLPLEDRAKNEVKLLSESIHNQIILAYEKALKEVQDEETAYKIVLESIEKDLELANQSLKEELLDFSKKSLDQIRFAGALNDNSLTSLEKIILPNIVDRSSVLGEHLVNGVLPKTKKMSPQNNEDNSDKLEFANNQEFLENIISSRPSTRWVSTSNQNISSGEIITKDENVSLQVKIEFMGVGIEAGPQITFRREYITNVNIMAEELSPIVLANGNFNSYKRDTQGKLILKDGKPQRRFMAFSCEATLRFSTDYRGAGGFKVAGMGLSGAVSQTFANSVTLNSRRVMIPDYINNKTVTMEYLSDLCNRQFLNANINDKLTVEKSLNIMMENVVAGLRFSHPNTKCAVDTDCIDWFNKEVMYLLKLGTYPRCSEEEREKYRSCELRGLQGFACRVYKNGKMVSTGKFELDCDKGLKCVQYQEAGFLRYAKGTCQPIDPSTYRDPKKYPEYKTERDSNLIYVRVIK